MLYAAVGWLGKLPKRDCGLRRISIRQWMKTTGQDFKSVRIRPRSTECLVTR